jgi:small subunit ribosomal protein S19
MPRSVWKGPFVAKSLLKKVEANAGSHKVINTYSRASVILPDFVGVTFGVYNGKTFVPVAVKEEMVGKKLGEFSPTRTFKGHGGDKKADAKK